MGGPCSTYGEKRGAHKILVGKPEGKRPLGLPRCKWEENFKMDIQEVEFEVWTGSSWLRIGTGADTCECGNERLGSIKCGEFLDWLRTV